MAIDRPMLKTLRDRMDAALKDLGKDLGVVIKTGRCTYTDQTATFKLEIASVASNGDVVTKEAQDFKLYAWRYALKAEDLWATFNYGGESYKIIGCKPRSSKAPILVQTPSGKVYKMPAHTVNLYLKASRSPATAK